MHLDVFSEGDSLFHRLDPRAKILVFVPFTFAVALTGSIRASGVYVLLSLICAAAARLFSVELLKRQLVLNGFVFFLWLTVPWSVAGRPVLQYQSLILSDAGIRAVLLVTLKANALFLLTCSMIATTEVFALGHALFHLRVPGKLVYLFLFLYRYIGVLHEEYSKLFRAAALRGFCPRTGCVTVRTMSYIFGMLLVRSYERSQRIYQALTLRGFRGDFPMLTHFRYQKADVCFVAVMTLVLAAQVTLWK